VLNLVDSHCHLNFDPLGTNLENVLKHARDNGVGHMLCVSVSLEKFPEILALAQTHPDISASVGVHPNEHAACEPSVEELVAQAGNERVVAIGETGLDYYRTDEASGWQQVRFRQHIRAARECGKPLIIHMRDASEDTLRILREEGADHVGGVMHCFTGTWDVAKQALDMDFYISFSGVVTFKNAENLRKVAKQIPEDRLLVETDAPYLAPVPHRGKTNEPAFVRFVAERLAEVRAMPLERLTTKTTQNFFRLFPQATAVSY